VTRTFITGDKALDKALNDIGTKVAARVMTRSIRAGLGVLREAIKDEVTPRSVKRAIGSRFKKKKRNQGYRAVVGGAVGKRNKGKGGTRGGVGIAKQNVHWYLMGTSGRQTASGAGRGSMPKNRAVAVAFQKSSATTMRRVTTKAREELLKEVKKIATRRNKLTRSN